MKHCSNCGVQLEDTALVCTACGANQEENQQPAPVQEAPATQEVANEPVAAEETPGKKKKTGVKLALIAAVVVVVLGVAALVGYFTDWFGLYSPIDKLALAFKSTLTAQSMTVNVDIDGEEAELRTMVDKEGKNLTVMAKIDNYIYLADDGKYYEYHKNYAAYSDVYEYDNDQVFSIYEKATAEEVNWDDIAKEAEVKDYVNADKFEDFFITFYKEYMKSDEWLEETMGYSLEDGVYTFKPEADDFVKDMIDLVKEKELVKGDYKDYIDEVEEDFERELDDLESLEIKITLDGDYLSKVEAEVKTEWDTFDVTVEFSKINETTIDKDEVEKIAKTVNDAIEADKCPQCGYRRGGDEYCWNCQQWCYTCQTYRDKNDMIGYSGACNHCSAECQGCWNVFTKDNLYNYNNQYTYCYNCYLNALNNAYNNLF